MGGREHERKDQPLGDGQTSISEVGREYTFFLETFCDVPYINFGQNNGFIFDYTFISPCVYIGYETGVYIVDFTFDSLFTYFGYDIGGYILDCTFDSLADYTGYIGGYIDALENECICGWENECIHGRECGPA
jgi:hypothetical protein